MLAAAVCAHWASKPPVFLYVASHEDIARLRSHNAPQNMAVVKHLVMRLMQTPKRQAQPQSPAKTANLNPDRHKV